jgi:hypothetical protein
MLQLRQNYLDVSRAEGARQASIKSESNPFPILRLLSPTLMDLRLTRQYHIRIVIVVGLLQTTEITAQVGTLGDSPPCQFSTRAISRTHGRGSDTREDIWASSRGHNSAVVHYKRLSDGRILMGWYFDLAALKSGFVENS